LLAEKFVEAETALSPTAPELPRFQPNFLFEFDYFLLIYYPLKPLSIKRLKEPIQRFNSLSPLRLDQRILSLATALYSLQLI